MRLRPAPRWTFAFVFVFASTSAACSTTSPVVAPRSSTPDAHGGVAGTTQRRGDDGASAREAGATLDAWHAAAARSDEAGYFELFDDDGVFLGTDATERWGKEAFRAYAHEPFQKGRGWDFKSTRRALTIARGGDLAFFDEDLTSPRFAPARGSGVLVRRDAGWRVLHYVLSLTIPNDRFEAVKTSATAKVALAPEGKLADLGWLAGTWAGTRAAPGDDRSGDLSVELAWSQARGGTMLGTLRIATPPKGDAPAETQSLDALRIEATDQGSTYTAERKGRAPLRYEVEPVRAASGAEGSGHAVTFVDATTQVRLTFSTDGEALRIVVERKGKVEESTLLQRAVIVSH